MFARPLFFSLALTALTGTALADVTLPAIISDHMVLSKSARTPVWGTAAPGENVTVSVAGQSAQVRADASGHWTVKLNLSASAPGPHQMTVKGNNQLTVNDVVIGQVWLASGQSNMGVQVSETIDADKDIAQSANPMLRHFSMGLKMLPQGPTDQFEGQWFVADPSITGHFSAVAYFFGKELQKNLNVPVGVINSSCGGTYAESWMSADALNSDADLKAARGVILDAFVSFPKRLTDYAAAYAQWAKANGREDKPAANPDEFASPAASLESWKKIKLPADFASVGLPDAGVTWLRRTINVPDNVAGRGLRIDLGNITEFTTVYWNGVKVGETTPASGPGVDGKFMYMIPGDLLKAGPNTLAVRIFSPRGGARLSASQAGYDFRAVQDNFLIFLAQEEWLAKNEYALPALDPAVAQSSPHEPAPPDREKNIPGSLYNGMIHPLLPFLINGWIWYQGESNTDYASQYRTIFPLLIKDWRAHWGLGDLPFYFVQLPGYGPMAKTPGDSRWAELREAQELALALPKTGRAVTIDLGEELNVHPRNKKDVGTRLAWVVLADTYGKAIPHAAPVYKSMQVVGDKVRINFTTDSALVAHPIPATYQPRSNEAATAPLVRNSPSSQLEGFAICGADQKWVWADAKIDGQSVIVSSPKVPKPANVRYAWSDNPITNLYNANGLPAAPFRTDNFPLPVLKRLK